MLQFISHYTDDYSYLDSIRIAIEGGCRWIQLRMKDATADDIRPVAIEAQRLCREAGATFIIDDHVELVRELRANGVHLGKKDMPIAAARELLGPDFIIGGTANTIDDVRMHHAAGASYIGCGPFRFTTTKKGLSPVLGLDGYRAIMQVMQAEGIVLPVVAIGGITAEDIPDIMRTGVSGVALSGAVLRATDPVAEMRRVIGCLVV
ncbi:MAG: thiamine phosphate synthase [Prevotellaceae bacterium]|nr:thiamine phosphate synthase [Prevotellaceae bacterium]